MAYIKLVDEPLAREIHGAIRVKNPYPHIKGDAIDGFLLYGHAPNSWQLVDRACDAVLGQWKEEYDTILGFEDFAVPFATLLAARVVERGGKCGVIHYSFDSPDGPYIQQLPLPLEPKKKIFPVGYRIRDGSEIKWLLREGLPHLNAEASQVLVMIDADTWPNRNKLNGLPQAESPEILALTRASLGQKPNILRRYLGGFRG